MAKGLDNGKKPWYKKWWVWVLAIIIILVVLAANGGGSDSSDSSNKSSKTEKVSSTSSTKNTDSLKKSSSTKAFNAADYNTGITYEQLARTPDDYKNQNITLTGKVIQVVEGDDENDLRVAIDGNYDNVAMVAYDPDIMNGSRILENDKITFYAESLGTTTYKSTIGGKITIPVALAKKIDNAGTAPDDYGY